VYNKLRKHGKRDSIKNGMADRVVVVVIVVVVLCCNIRKRSALDYNFL